jgi:two-component system, NarL family, nitrate/nitrite response regulator NarL
VLLHPGKYGNTRSQGAETEKVLACLIYVPGPVAFQVSCLATVIDLITVVHIDGRSLLLEGLAAAFSQMQEFRLLGRGGNLHEAVALVQRHKPDILLLDFDIPGNGIEAAKICARTSPVTRIVFLAASDHPQRILAAFNAGAMGYIKDTAAATDIAEVLRTIKTGRRAIWPKNAGNLLDVLNGSSESGVSPMRPVFTERELDVVRMLKDGFTNREIADALGISEKTVKHYVGVIMQKLSVRNRVEATRAILSRFSELR